ncbi:hypothetical protein BWI17_04420 [Betaproteobacteria bacterium GR16-43]|nr:hypothetical protein BWI17_04420 [Betaproteobacteria bacterium GR16-43]
MCLIALAWKADPRYLLVVAANRDEWRERPTEAAQWWKDHPEILAGRDLQAGGTWMGVTKSGRFAAVTNFRDPSDKRSTALSRGSLVADFLLSEATPGEYLDHLAERAPLFNGFNLLVGDRQALAYFGSREKTQRTVTPGVHGLSNHLLDEPWPKVTRARRGMEVAIADTNPANRLFAVLSDRSVAADGELPDTGVGLAWERRLAPALITGTDYGTRASTVLTIASDGAVTFEERTLDAAGAPSGVQKIAFRVS